MRARRLVLTAAVLASTGIVSAWTARSTDPTMQWCRPTDDMVATFLHRYLVRIGTSPDSVTARMRDTLGISAPLTSSDIALVSDEVLCERASRALDSTFFEAPTAASVYMARIGPRYAIHPPGVQAGEFSFLVYTDTAFRPIVTTNY